MLSVALHGEFSSYGIAGRGTRTSGIADCDRPNSDNTSIPPDGKQQIIMAPASPPAGYRQTVATAPPSLDGKNGLHRLFQLFTFPVLTRQMARSSILNEHPLARNSARGFAGYLS